jgi:hypothetical protein
MPMSTPLSGLKSAALAAGLSVLTTAALAAAHGGMAVPDPVRVPTGHQVVLETVGVGEITYECREKAAAAGRYEWAFVAPMASLHDAHGRIVGRYYGGPTWEASDGSKVTGRQVAVAPAAAGSIALQLVRAERASGAGTLQGTTYIQRLNTQGGVAPMLACGADNRGARQQVAYRADYVFYGGRDAARMSAW